MYSNTPYPQNNRNVSSLSEEEFDNFNFRDLNENSPLTKSSRKNNQNHSSSSLPTLPPKPLHMQPEYLQQEREKQQRQKQQYSRSAANKSNNQQYPYSSDQQNNLKKMPSTHETEYELTNFATRDLPPIPPENNSRNHNSHNDNRGSTMTFASNPFTDMNYISRNYDNVDLPPSPPSSDPFKTEEMPSDDDFHSDDLKNKMKKNEKNRIRTLRRKPRFHYTRLPYFTIVISVIQIIVFIVELAKMSQLTGSAFQTKPYFNPMLGPLTYLLIYMGARYVPCMHQIKGITDDTSIMFPCANSTTESTFVCPLNELCGLSGIPQDGNAWLPNQWYRIFIPIFLHAGFLHIIFNLLLQVTMGASIERNIGILKYAIIYIVSGIGGFLLGANFTPQGIASTGALGALFGIVATNIILFIYTGRKNTNMYGTKHYALFIFIMIAEIVITFVLGLLPGLDNFSHLGGFAMGILTSILLLKDPFWVFKDGIITYPKNPSTWQQFKNNWNPLFAIEDKIKNRFIIWCHVRIVALVLIIVYYALLCKNFFNANLNQGNRCSWCRYFNCVPVKGWCDIGNVSVTTQTASNTDSASATPTPSQTTVSTNIYSTAVYTTTLPTSVENSGSSSSSSNSNSQSEGTNGGLKRRFAESFSINAKRDVDVSLQYGIGSGLYLVLFFFTISFLKKKKII